MNHKPKILTNMAFWQSPEWMAQTDSIYPLDPEHGDPAFMAWWRVAWTLFRRRAHYDVVHTMGIRESFAYAFLCWITGRRSRQIMTEVFIDSPRHHPVWSLKTWLYQRLARRAYGFITNSSEEIVTNARRFDVPESRFRYIPLNTTIDHPEFRPAPDGPLFCAGRTLRDYRTLLKVIDATREPWVVIGGAGDLEWVNLPERVTLYRDIDRERYLERLREARVVVLPLLPTERATGQVVLLEAMSYGKAVITTLAPGTRDIIRHGENGYLVEPHDAATITVLIHDLLYSPATAERLGKQALHDVLAYHRTEQQATARLEAIRDLWAQARADT